MKREKKSWLDEPRNVTRLVYGLLAVCLLLVAGDFLYQKETHFSWEGWWGFHGFFGFFAFLFLVLAGKELRRILMRDEDYYDR